jgi:hypothetical protein
MAIAGAQRKQVLKVVVLSLLIDLVYTPPEPITFTRTDNAFRSPLHLFCPYSLRFYRFIVRKIHPRILSSTVSSTI